MSIHNGDGVFICAPMETHNSNLPMFYGRAAILLLYLDGRVAAQRPFAESYPSAQFGGLALYSTRASVKNSENPPCRRVNALRQGG